MKIRVALVTWWDNWEREVSLRSADTFLKHLSDAKYDIVMFDIPSQIDSFQTIMQDFDIVIPVIHWVWWEDWTITKLCEDHNIPYFFTTASSHALCINKLECWNVVSEWWFSVPKSVIVKNIEDIETKSLDGKIFVKPTHGWSSVDSGVFDSREEAKDLMTKIISYDSALVQEYVTWREFTVSIDWDYDKHPKVLAISEIVTGQEFFDYEAKYSLKNTREITPADIADTLQKHIENTAIWIYEVCKIQCLWRIDFIYTPETNTIYFLEINTIPGFTETSFFPQAIVHSWLSIWQYLDKKISELILGNK